MFFEELSEKSIIFANTANRLYKSIIILLHLLVLQFPFLVIFVDIIKK